MLEKIIDLFYEKEGKYTEELKLKNSILKNQQLPNHLLGDSIIQSVCGYCSTGCSLDIHIKDNTPLATTPTEQSLVNHGRLCPKGWEAINVLDSPNRATQPLLKNNKGIFHPISWDCAMDVFHTNITEIQKKYGLESASFLSTGQIATEEMALLGSLAKFGMNILHCDGNTRQCMATAVVAYKQSFGFDAPPYSYKDFEESDVIILIGSNMCITHPIMWEHICMNKNNPTIITIDPRLTETTQASHHHYALNPKTDLILFYGITKILIDNHWIDSTFIQKNLVGFEELKVHSFKYSLQVVSKQTGIKEEEIYHLANLIHQGKRVSLWWTMGINQGHEAVRTAQSIINVALITGNIGKIGTGANSITGQCNAMGSRLFSNTTNLLGGHDFTNLEHRQKIAKLLKIDVKMIPNKNGWAYDQIIEGIFAKKIKGLWVIGTNPAHSWINHNDFKNYIGNLDFLVVQDMYCNTETAKIANLILPAAAWGEKNGTFINSERRLGVIKPVSQPPGESKTDFDIFKCVAKRWGYSKMFQDWKTPESTFQILKTLTKGQPCDITGITNYQMLELHHGIQWPLKETDTLTSNQRILFEDGFFFHPDGKARLIIDTPKETPETINDNYPFVLITGRGTSSQWHTQTRTSQSKILTTMYPKIAYVEINFDDAIQYNIRQNQWVFVVTARGKAKVQASLVYSLKKGEIFMPMHYPETNYLTLASFDPYSRQPSYKHCVANIWLKEYEK